MNPRISSILATFFQDSFGEARVALGLGQGEESFDVEFSALTGRSDEAFGHKGADVVVHEFLFQRVDDGDGFAVVGNDQGFARDDLFQAGGEIIFEVGDAGCLHIWLV